MQNFNAPEFRPNLDQLGLKRAQFVHVLFQERRRDLSEPARAGILKARARRALAFYWARVWPLQKIISKSENLPQISQRLAIPRNGSVRRELCET